MIYDLKYFIDKFQNIPEDKWIIKKFRNSDSTKHCAFGHCGAVFSSEDTIEAKSLIKVVGGFYEAMVLMDVNDGKKEFSYLGTTPKQRVINYLKTYEKE